VKCSNCGREVPVVYVEYEGEEIGYCPACEKKVGEKGEK